jgi:hypothetical protein
MNYNPAPSPVSDAQWNEFVARKIEKSLWKKWFAWHPVKIHGRSVWLKTVYRRCINTYVDMDNWKRYEYGTIFDVLRNESKS